MTSSLFAQRVVSFQDRCPDSLEEPYKQLSRDQSHANHIARDSKATESDLHVLFPTTTGRTSVVHPGFNAAYNRLPDEILVDRLSDLKIPPKNDVLLHVGSNAWYKNRMGVLRIFKRYKSQASKLNASLVFAGPELDAEQCNYAKKHGLTPISCALDL